MFGDTATRKGYVMILGNVDTEKADALTSALIQTFNKHVALNKMSFSEIATSIHQFHTTVVDDLADKSGNEFIKNVVVHAFMQHYYEDLAHGNN